MAPSFGRDAALLGIDEQCAAANVTVVKSTPVQGGFIRG